MRQHAGLHRGIRHSLVQRYETHRPVSAVRSVVDYRDGCGCETVSSRNMNLQYSTAAIPVVCILMPYWGSKKDWQSEALGITRALCMLARLSQGAL